MKILTIILGITSVIAFSCYYCYAFYHWPNIPQMYNDLMNWTIYLAISASFFELGRKENAKARYFIYNAISQFFLFLVLTYVFNIIFDTQIIMHKVFIAIILTFLCSISLYFIRWGK